MKIIYVVRHGQTDWNVQKRIQGHEDVPLNDMGRVQSRALQPLVSRLGIEAFLSSDLSRALETATIAGQVAGVPVYQDVHLREIHLGKLQGKTAGEIEAEFGVHLSHRLRTEPLGDADVAQLGSEHGVHVFERARDAIVRFLRTEPYATIGVATHGGVIRRLIQYSWGSGDFPAPIPNGIVYPFSWSEETGLKFENSIRLPGR